MNVKHVKYICRYETAGGVQETPSIISPGWLCSSKNTEPDTDESTDESAKDDQNDAAQTDDGAADGGTDTDDSELATDDETPGFGFVIALVAFISMLSYLVRRN